jgi:type I restriction enzyme S subunit
MSAIDRYKLPQNWVWTRLGEVAEIIMGSSPPSLTYNKERKGLPFFQGKTDFGPLFPTARIWCSSPHKVAEEGDVLISVRAPVGPTNLSIERACIGRGLGAIRPRAEIPSLFVLFYLRSIENSVSQMGTGSTFTAIKRSDLESVPFPLAPLNEQKRIVAKIEALFAESKTVREALEKVPLLLQKCRESILVKAVKGELTHRNPKAEPAEKLLEKIRQERKRAKQLRLVQKEDHLSMAKPELPKTWIWTDVGSLIIDARYGTSQKCSTDPHGVPVLRIPNVVNGRLDFRDLKYAELKKDEIARLSLSLGDILVVRTNGSLNLVGRVSVVDRLDQPFAFASYLIRLRPALSGTISKYLRLVLNSQLGRKVIEEKSRTTAGQYNVNLETLRSIPVPLPPYEEMQSLVDKIEASFSFIDAVRLGVDKARERVNRLGRSILKKAFSGTLTPQDPKEESASVLLQHVKSALLEVRAPLRKIGQERRPLRKPQQKLMGSARSIGSILREMGQATIEEVFEASGLSMDDFWDELKKESEAGLIEQSRKGSFVFLRLRT